MIPKIFTFSPVEASMWTMMIDFQNFMVVKVFASSVFISIMFLFFGYKIIREAQKYIANENPAFIHNVSGHFVCMVLALTIFMYANARPFLAVDANDRSWESSQTGKSTINNGLFFYTLIHFSSHQLSNYISKLISGFFKDELYQKSPDLAVKTILAASSVNLDDSNISFKIDKLVRQCGNSKSINTKDDFKSLSQLFNLSNSKCQLLYSSLNSDLQQWVKDKTPFHVSLLNQVSPSINFYKMLADEKVVNNYIIASSVIDYGTTQKASKGSINSQKNALLMDDSEHFWYTFQRLFSGDLVPYLFDLFNITDDGQGGAQAKFAKNEAAQMFDRMVALLPAFRGMIKGFLALSFVVCVFSLSVGYLKPVVWWLGVLFYDFLYTPLSTLLYSITNWFNSRDFILSNLDGLNNDPLLLSGIASFNEGLIGIHTVYYLVQMVLMSMFVVSVIGGGWAVNKMSWLSGAGVGAGATRLATSSMKMFKKGAS